MDRTSNLLDEALGLDERAGVLAPGGGRVVLIEDCVETSAAFVLHHLMKRALSLHTSGVVLFVAFAQPFSHYERILRKLGCNLVSQRDSNRFFFFDMLKLEYQGGFVELYRKIQKAVEDSILSESQRNCITVMVDDVSLMEAAANGNSSHVLDFLHYCRTLTSELGCSLVTLNHEDVYSSADGPTLILEMEYLADAVVKVEPLVTGLATDVHGQLTVLNKGVVDEHGCLSNKLQNFHFKVKENGVDYFYPGSRT